MYTRNTVMHVENTTEIVHLFCLALVPKSCRHMAQKCCPSPMLSGLLMPSGSHSHLGHLCPVLSSISFLPVPGKGSAGSGDHPSLHPLSSLSPLSVKVRHSPLTSSSVSPSGNTFWRGTVCRFCREGFAGTWLNLQHFSGLGQNTQVDKTVLGGELLNEEARVGAT